MSAPRTASARSMPTRSQRYCLASARTGKLFRQAPPMRLVLQQPTGKYLPVKMFDMVAVKSCERAGWTTELDQGDGRYRIITTPAGDAVLAKLLQLARAAPGGRLEAAYRQEAMR